MGASLFVGAMWGGGAHHERSGQLLSSLLAGPDFSYGVASLSFAPSGRNKEVKFGPSYRFGPKKAMNAIVTVCCWSEL